MGQVDFDISEWNLVDVIATFYITIDALDGLPRTYGVTYEVFNEINTELERFFASKKLPKDALSFEIDVLLCKKLGLKFDPGHLNASGYEKLYGEGAAQKAMSILRESGGEKRRSGYMAKAFCHINW